MLLFACSDAVDEEIERFKFALFIVDFAEQLPSVGAQVCKPLLVGLQQREIIGELLAAARIKKVLPRFAVHVVPIYPVLLTVQL